MKEGNKIPDLLQGLFFVVVGAIEEKLVDLFATNIGHLN
jgi:hypothetical protein